MSKLLALLVAILKALPTIESIIRRVIAERDKEKASSATKRRQEKDKAVDDAIDTTGPSDSGNDQLHDGSP